MSVAVRKRKAKPPAESSPWPLVLRVRPALDVTEDQFFALCQINEMLWIERTADGDWVIMPPAGWEASHRNLEIGRQVANWARQDGTGEVTESSGGYRLPNTAVRAPDVAWIRKDRLAGTTSEEQAKFLPLCPDFVLELWSPSDCLSTLRRKMEEYLANGAQLGWLLYPPERRVYVYRPGAAVEVLENPERLAGDPVLPGFTLDLREIW
jgi:Uma2 family endonuclease